jgi:two-component system alkaline phosphatase synthesis response regulator PhoP
MSVRILLVEDESGIAEVMADLLRAEDYEVEISPDGTLGLELALSGAFDILILDLMLPGKSGYEICADVREAGYDGGILMLTARGLIEDKVKGLKTGADDYLVKPFDPDELLARTEALLRRTGKTSRTPVSKIRFGNVSVDFANNEITKNGVSIALTSKEFELLRILVNHRGRAIARDEILARVWKEQPFITPRTVDVHMAWLRQKLEDLPQTPRHLLTVRGEGYQFNAG